MLATSEVMAFLPAVDLDRAEAFYGDVLNLDVVARSPYATTFQLAEGILRIIKVDNLTPQPFTVFGWLVTDIREIVHRLRERGVDLLVYEGFDQDDDAIWATPSGDLVVWFHDPDMNVLSLTQHA